MTPTTEEHSLFAPRPSTSQLAHEVAAKMRGDRYRSIVQSLAAGPKCIFEVAQELGCFDHQISGRFGELVKLGVIVKTAEERTKPATGCRCKVYAIAGGVDELLDDQEEDDR